MEGLEKDGESVSHGFKVALGSLGSCALYELLLDFDIESLDIDSLVRRSVSWETRKAEIELRIGKRPYAPQMIEQSRKKFVSGQDLRERLERLRARWNPLKRRLREQLIPYARSRDLLEQAGCPVRPEAIALTREHAVATFDLAQMMRQRYTALDAAYELGMLDEWKNRIAASDLYWR
jgi:glycerol-1-phosphate dehydrogenase [NAD(P)+]